MINVDAQVSYWRAGSEEDWQVAQELLGVKRARHALYFGHLALEKALKALVTRYTNDIPPRLHNLLRLSELAELELNSDQQKILERANSYNIEGRYPDTLSVPPTVEETRTEMAHLQEVFEWLMQKL